MPISGFIKLGTINGEATAPGYQKWIELDSWSWGCSREVNAEGSEGRLAVNQFSFTSQLGPHSAAVAALLVNGDAARTGTLAVVDEGGNMKVPAVQAKCEFSEILLSTYDVGGVSDDEPREQVSFAFQKMTMTTGPNTVSVSVLPAG